MHFSSLIFQKCSEREVKSAFRTKSNFRCSLLRFSDLSFQQWSENASFLPFWRPANQAPATRTVPSTLLLWCVCGCVCVCAQCACVSVHISPQPRTCKFLHFVMQYHQNIGVLAGWKRPVLHAGQCDTLCVSTFCTYQAPSSQYQRSGVATHRRKGDCGHISPQR